MSRRTTILLLGCFALIGASQWYSSYQTSDKILDAARGGCGRSLALNQDVNDLARALGDGFANTDARLGGPISPQRQQAEADIDRVQDRTAVRVKLDCDRTYPPPRVIQVSYQRPVDAAYLLTATMP